MSDHPEVHLNLDLAARNASRKANRVMTMRVIDQAPPHRDYDPNVVWSFKVTPYLTMGLKNDHAPAFDYLADARHFAIFGRMIGMDEKARELNVLAVIRFRRALCLVPGPDDAMTVLEAWLT